MQFIVALLALPAAVLAAPAELVNRQANFVRDSVSCACTSSAGKIETSSACPFGERVASGEFAGYCAITGSFSAGLDSVMNDGYCGQFAGFGKAVCKTTKMCLKYPECRNLKNAIGVCGVPAAPIPDLYCSKQ